MYSARCALAYTPTTTTRACSVGVQPAPTVQQGLPPLLPRPLRVAARPGMDRLAQYGVNGNHRPAQPGLRGEQLQRPHPQEGKGAGLPGGEKRWSSSGPGPRRPACRGRGALQAAETLHAMMQRLPPTAASLQAPLRLNALLGCTGSRGAAQCARPGDHRARELPCWRERQPWLRAGSNTTGGRERGPIDAPIGHELSAGATSHGSTGQCSLGSAAFGFNRCALLSCASIRACPIVATHFTSLPASPRPLRIAVRRLFVGLQPQPPIAWRKRRCRPPCRCSQARPRWRSR